MGDKHMVHTAHGSHRTWFTPHRYTLEAIFVGMGIFSAPYVFLIFLPLSSITGSLRTGYDMRGWLCRHLTMEEARAELNLKPVLTLITTPTPTLH
jgi:hypothetical protein